MIVIGITGTQYNLDSTPIGSGGEGAIFHAYITRAAKVYKPSVLTQELESKLKIMIEHPPNDSVLTQVAWPLDLIYDGSAKCIGFIMPELSINAELSDIYQYPSKLPISVHQKVNIAQNICAVISEVHKAGYIFGDFNPRNIGLDTNTGLVSFLDTDTYHVVDNATNTTYRCSVCAPGYAAPELLDKCSEYIIENPSASKAAYSLTPLPTFTQETDNFALAIHIFKLLMNGYTPFGGIIESASVSQSSPGVGDMAVRRDSYCFKPGYKHQSAAIPALNAFPDEIADLFTRAFIAGKHDPKQRPSAEEWHSALSKHTESLVTCQTNSLHQYSAKNDICPYCEADGKYEAILSEKTAQTATLKQAAYTPPPKVALKQKAWQPTANPQQSIMSQAVSVTTRQNDVISAGAEHSAAITANGQLLAWGSNVHGQLGIGIGTTMKSLSPQHVMDDVVAVSAGYYHTMAITADGNLWAWGFNHYGQLGDNTIEHCYRPVNVLDNVIAVSAGQFHTIALTAGGVLYAWGDNDYGQIGDGTFQPLRYPAAIMHNVKAIAAGCDDSAAITTDGGLFVWGNVYDTSYNGNVIIKDQPVPKRIMDNAADVSLGEGHALAICSDGSLWAWGENGNGQLGCDSDIYLLTPMRIMDDVVAVSAGAMHSMAITANGDLLAWGNNKSGQLGTEKKGFEYTPKNVLAGVVAVSAGLSHTMCITDSGHLCAWGSNRCGKLGSGSTSNSREPLLIREDMKIL